MTVQLLKGADSVSQWYYDDYPGGSVFTRLDKFVAHTTETKGFPGYGGGASAPNATWHPVKGIIRQHFPNNVSSRALRDPSSTLVRENRDNVFQLEIVAYSAPAPLGGLHITKLTDAHYTQLARILLQLHASLGLPLTSAVKWFEGAGGYRSVMDAARLSGPDYDAYRGVLGHMHVSGNTHFDPGGFYWSKLAHKLATLQPVVVPTVDLSRLISAAKTDHKYTGTTHKTYASGTLTVERALRREGLLAGTYVDGHYGTMTLRAYAAWQRRCGFSGSDADGVPGSVSLTKLGRKHGFKVVP